MKRYHINRNSIRQQIYTLPHTHNGQPYPFLRIHACMYWNSIIRKKSKYFCWKGSGYRTFWTRLFNFAYLLVNSRCISSCEPYSMSLIITIHFSEWRFSSRTKSLRSSKVEGLLWKLITDAFKRIFWWDGPFCGWYRRRSQQGLPCDRSDGNSMQPCVTFTGVPM